MLVGVLVVRRVFTGTGVSEDIAAGVEGSGLMALSVDMRDLRLSSLCEAIDWLLVRAFVDVAVTERVTLGALAPFPRLPTAGVGVG